MATNWLAKDAARAIQEGKVENVLDIGKRFPLFSRLATQCNEAGLQLLDTLPKYVTARTIEAALKGDAVAATGDGDEDGDEPTPATPAATPAAGKTKAAAATPAAPAATVTDYTGKTPKELFTLATERGLAVEPRQPAEIYLKALKAADTAAAKAAKAAAAKAPAAKDDDWGDEPATPAAKGSKAAPAADDDWDIA